MTHVDKKKKKKIPLYNNNQLFIHTVNMDQIKRLGIKYKSFLSRRVHQEKSVAKVLYVNFLILHCWIINRERVIIYNK